MRHCLSFFLLLSAAHAAEPLSVNRAPKDFSIADPAKRWKAPDVRASVNPMGEPSPAAFTYQVLWTPEHLYFRFECPYDELVLRPELDTKNETYQLWDWDVTEVFIGADFNNIKRYREFQVSPRGEWVDLDIDRSRSVPGPTAAAWNSGFTVSGKIDEKKKVWYAAMKIPMKSIDESPIAAGKKFRFNVYRLSGTGRNRSTMWVPVGNPSHHTPEKFGEMILAQ
jgi:hypothetical protein